MRTHLAILLLALGWGPASAQTAPTSAEIANYTGLHRAAYDGRADDIRQLAAAGENLEARDRHGRTAVHVAAFAAQAEALSALAAAGANMNARESSAYDAVTIAAVANDPVLMSLAISLGNDPGLVTSPYDGTALIAAAHLGHAEVVERLVRAGAPLDHVNNLGWTALLEAVILGDGGPNHQAVVRTLVEAGADREIGDRNGMTPLDHARARGYAAIVRTLESPGR
ncbi:MAG: ankyrin repeat domain-containing protein [Burkholderiaceae bacterium]